VVVDGAEGKEYDGFAVLIFSPDGQRVAYAAGRGGKWLLVVDGVEGKEYNRLGKGSLIFSPDGRRVAYMAGRGEKPFVVVDGVEGKEIKKQVGLRLRSLREEEDPEKARLQRRTSTLRRLYATLRTLQKEVNVANLVSDKTAKELERLLGFLESEIGTPSA